MRYTLSLLLASLLALPAQADVPRVVADLPATGSLVALVMGDLGQPQVLLDKGADAHSFQLRPSQAATLADAGLIVWIGPEMTPWLDRTLDGPAAGVRQRQLLSVPGTILLTATEPDNDAAAADHDHGETDPHAWLSPINAALWITVIATDLADLDPANATTYAANAAKAQTDLTALDTEIAALLHPAQGVPIVVAHDAYGYFASHYGLTLAGTIADGDAAAPGAAHLRSLQALLVESPICVFPEVNYDPKLAALLIEGTPARLGTALDPEGAAIANGPGLYAEILRGLATAIAGCVRQ